MTKLQIKAWLLITLLLLKLVGAVHWSWWVITAPLWLEWAILLASIATGIVTGALVLLFLAL